LDKKGNFSIETITNEHHKKASGARMQLKKKSLSRITMNNFKCKRSKLRPVWRHLQESLKSTIPNKLLKYNMKLKQCLLSAACRMKTDVLFSMSHTFSIWVLSIVT